MRKFIPGSYYTYQPDDGLPTTAIAIDEHLLADTNIGISGLNLKTRKPEKLLTETETKSARLYINMTSGEWRPRLVSEDLSAYPSKDKRFIWTNDGTCVFYFIRSEINKVKKNK
jgi:hypothetical protein